MLKVGIIGLGVGRSHAKAFEAIEGVQVAAVADSHAERLRTFPGELLRRYDAFEVLCDDPGNGEVSGR